MTEFDMLRNAAAGMDVQRRSLDLAARNVAASEADGATFDRLVPRYAIAADPTGDESAAGEAYEPPDDPEAVASDDVDDPVPVRYLGSRVERGITPDAVTEMVAVLDAQRAYDANASVFDVAKRLAERTIDAGRIS